MAATPEPQGPLAHDSAVDLTARRRCVRHQAFAALPAFGTRTRHHRAETNHVDSPPHGDPMPHHDKDIALPERARRRRVTGLLVLAAAFSGYLTVPAGQRSTLAPARTTTSNADTLQRTVHQRPIPSTEELGGLQAVAATFSVFAELPGPGRRR